MTNFGGDAGSNAYDPQLNELSVRTRNALLRAGFRTVEQLRQADPDALLALRNMGTTALAEVDDLVAKSSPTPELPQNLPEAAVKPPDLDPQKSFGQRQPARLGG